ncbi:MAG: CRISPR-associated endonuclease Cas2 [Alicyclobacillus sp.]|nr:CRISPR-associated endonuclease Cas2 [Alicyclobacillus sp.]
MLVLITYDVNTTTALGRRRLRKVAQVCENFGQRVQCSVFECLVDPEQFAELKHKLVQLIDKDRDSLRFYLLGAKWRGRVEHIGAKQSYDPEGFLMI